MKKLIILSVFLLVSNVMLIKAMPEVSIEYQRQSNQSENIGPSDGLKVAYIPKTLPVYAWISGERSRFNMVGQNLGSVNLFGAGFGTQYKIKPVIFWIDGGWFYPYHKDDSRRLLADGKDVGDRPELYLSCYGNRKWDYYKFHISGNLGASFGIQYHIGPVIVGAGYRILELPLSVEGKMLNSNLSWSRYEDQNVSGPLVFIGCRW